MERRTSRIVCWILQDQAGFVTADRGEDEVLLVFRAPREARRFQERTATEHLKLVGMSFETLQGLLEKYDLGWVAVVNPRTGERMVDLFTAEAFIDMLEEGMEE